MIDWTELLPEDFGCSKCNAPEGEGCKDPSGLSSKPHAARTSKVRHEKYTQGLYERCSQTRFNSRLSY